MAAVLLCSGHQYAPFLRSVRLEDSMRFSFRVLTEIGTDLLSALRRSPDLEYLCRVRDHYRNHEMVAEIWSITDAGMEKGYHLAVSKLPDVCEPAALQMSEP